MLIVLATSPRVAPGLLSWPAWQALRSAAAVYASPGHPQLPALDEAGIAYQVADEFASEPAEGDVVWLPAPGEPPPLPPGARLLHGSADLPGAHLIDLVATMDRLRTECPWDARQTHDSLAPHLLEEPYEALEALESGDHRAFCEELGDVLLQVAFHARIAAERGDGTSFTIDDVADGIVAKLVRRHPHVFGDVTVSGADEVKRNWDTIKKEEKRALAERAGVSVPGQAEPSVLDGVPFGQPALSLAAQLQRRAARAGAPDELTNLDHAAPAGPEGGTGNAAPARSDDGSAAPAGSGAGPGYAAPAEIGGGSGYAAPAESDEGSAALAGSGDGSGYAASAEPDDGSGYAASAGSGEDIGRELFRLVAKARALGRDPEMELRAAARRYGDLVRAWERS